MFIVLRLQRPRALGAQASCRHLAGPGAAGILPACTVSSIDSVYGTSRQDARGPRACAPSLRYSVAAHDKAALIRSCVIGNW
jgi:hypothetical protein